MKDFNINWADVQEEAVSNLKSLIKFDTTNPPGNEIIAAKWLETKLAQEGIETRLLESAPGRASLVARLQGTGKKAPLMLEGHLDVVPAEHSQWELDPFSAEEKNGSIYGRGAVDMKNMVAMNLTALVTLKKMGVKPERDLIFCAVADEEAGGEMGAKFLVENHPELVRAEYMLGEVGGFSVYNKGGKTVYPIGVAEKGLMWARLVARGEPGHGSMPIKNNAVLKLAKALAAIGENDPPLHPTPVTREFIAALTKALPMPNRAVLPLLLQPKLGERVLKIMPAENRKQFNALLRNTITPTVLAAGVKTNVIPSEASAELDIRILPGYDDKAAIAELRQIVGKEIEIEVIKYSPPPDMGEHRTPLFAAIERAVAKCDPGALVAPYLVPGFTDAKWFSKLGARAYGFSPLKLNPNDPTPFGKLFHGHNERIYKEGFKWGMKTYLEMLLDFLNPQ